MGIHKEVRKLFGSSVLNYMISARTAQGFDDSKIATLEERLDIISRWHKHKAEYQNARQKVREQGPEGQETGHLTPKGFFQTRHLSLEERKKLHAERHERREEERNKVQGEHGRRCPFCSKNTAHQHTPRTKDEAPSISDPSSDAQNLEFEQAIRESVVATSRGDHSEDIIIERAIRASIRELQSAQDSTLTDQAALDRAIQASIAEAGRGRQDAAQGVGSIAISDEESQHQALLKQAIQQSLQEYQIRFRTNDTHESTFNNADEDLMLALEVSRSSYDEQNQKVLQARTEEEIVLEYVKKQSVAENEYKRTIHKDKEIASSGNNADEEALKQAIEESLKVGAESME